MFCTTHLLPSTPPFSSIRSTVSIELGLVTDRTDTDKVFDFLALSNTSHLTTGFRPRPLALGLFPQKFSLDLRGNQDVIWEEEEEGPQDRLNGRDTGTS